MTIFDQAGATSIDIEINITLTAAPLAVSIALLGDIAPAAGCGTDTRCIGLNVTRDPAGSNQSLPPNHLVTFVANGGKMSTSFVLPHEVTTLAVRALLDRSILEVFVGNGRAAFTSGVGAPSSSNHASFVTAHTQATVTGASVWSMGCGWAQ
jgi:hypothetical protein